MLDDNFYEAIKAASYYNAKIFSENNAQGFAEYVIRKGYEKFVLPTPWNSLAMARGVTIDRLNRRGYKFGYKTDDDINGWNLRIVTGKQIFHNLF